MNERLTPYYLTTSFDEEIYTAGIVRFHQEKIMDEQGFTSLRFKYRSTKGILAKCKRLKQCISIAFSIQTNSIVYFHFPFHATIDTVLLYLLQKRGIKSVALIIDIDGLRDSNDQLLKHEVEQLSRFSYLVAHNEAMKKWLLQQLPLATIFNITVFDYAYSGKVTPKHLSSSICFAGNLSKATFVYLWQPISQLQFSVYGVGYDAMLNRKDGFTFKGIAPPDQLPCAIEGSFGLVWDGVDLYNCDPYLKFNNPHKLSLYLAAGMPVIVWQKSAVAAWVTENKIGFCINSIVEIGNCISNISSNDYELMRLNAVAIGIKISNGYYLKTVLKNIKHLD